MPGGADVMLRRGGSAAKNPFCLLLAAVLFGLVFVLPAPAARAEEQEVTILVYICGSDLESKEGEASTDIREMVSSGIGSSGEVTVLLATGGASRWSGYDISARNVQYFPPPLRNAIS